MPVLPFSTFGGRGFSRGCMPGNPRLEKDIYKMLLDTSTN